MKTRKMKGGDYVYNSKTNKWTMKLTKAESDDPDVREYHATELVVLNFLAKKGYNYNDVFSEKTKKKLIFKDGKQIGFVDTTYLQDRIDDAKTYLRENVDGKEGQSWKTAYEPFRLMLSNLDKTVQVRKRVDKREGGNGGHPHVTEELEKLLSIMRDLDNGTGIFHGEINYRQKYKPPKKIKEVTEFEELKDVQASTVKAEAAEEKMPQVDEFEKVLLTENVKDVSSLLTRYYRAFKRLDDPDSFEGNDLYSRIQTLEKKKESLESLVNTVPPSLKQIPVVTRMNSMFKSLFEISNDVQKAKIILELQKLPQKFKDYDRMFLGATERDVVTLKKIIDDFLKNPFPDKVLESLINLLDDISLSRGGTKRKFKHAQIFTNKYKTIRKRRTSKIR